MNLEEIKDKYAELILKQGIGIREGQCVRIQTEPYHWSFVHILEKKAYELGARFVHCKVDHIMSQVNMSRYQKPEYRGTVPGYLEKIVENLIEDEWSFINFDGKAEPELGKLIDQSAIVETNRNTMNIMKPLIAARMDGRCTWTMGSLPTEKWAQKIFGGDASQDSLCKLWEVLIPIMRLDQTDPAKAWANQAELLKKRYQYLNQQDLQYLHFIGPETDLKVYMAARSQWIGGKIEADNGRSFFPNIPTEEVFTSPDFRRTEGKVKVTRPVAVLGDQVEDAWFVFKEGKVIDYGAKSGKHLLDKFFEIDERSRYLGEVALVDGSSPIFKSGLIFHSILLDENAACHIALGRAIDVAIKNHETLKSDEQKLEEGFNQSIQHIDFMIGSEDINVTGFRKDGSSVNILNKGCFNF